MSDFLDTPPEPPPRNGDLVLATGRFLRFVVRDGWEFADRIGITGIVGLVAVTDERRLLLVEQSRPPVGGPVLELPAGLVGDQEGAAGEDLTAGAQRELREETGYEASNWTLLATGPVSPGTTSEMLTLLLATGLRRVGPGGGSGTESLVVHEMPLDAAEAWLRARERAGSIIDLKVFAGVYFARRAGL